MAKISFNGENRETHSRTLRELIEEFDLGEKKLAVELNREIVPRSKFETTLIQNDDVIEVVHFVGGG